MSSFWDGLQNNKDITEIPFYAVNRSLPEDTFYTNRKIAGECVKYFVDVAKKTRIDLNKYTLIEPSAGEGCFFDRLPECKSKIGLDIKPRKREIKKADFLTWYPSKKDKYIVIGNPPFGVRGAMALAFIKRSFLFADMAAFILPMSFYSNGKGSNMKRVENAKLLFNKRLSGKSFYTPDTREAVSVNTVFQIWIKGGRKKVFTDYDVSEYVDIYTCCSSPARYCGLGRGRKYDCFIASTFYKDDIKIVNSFEEVKYGFGYGLIIKKNKSMIRKILDNADWTKYCSDATNHCRHIRMFHIKKCFFDNKMGDPTKPAKTLMF